MIKILIEACLVEGSIGWDGVKWWVYRRGVPFGTCSSLGLKHHGYVGKTRIYNRNKTLTSKWYSCTFSKRVEEDVEIEGRWIGERSKKRDEINRPTHTVDPTVAVRFRQPDFSCPGLRPFGVFGEIRGKANCMAKPRERYQAARLFERCKK